MTKNPATSAVLLAFPLLLVFLGCSNNSNMKHEKTNTSYQVDSTSGGTVSTDTAAVTKPVSKPLPHTTPTVTRVDSAVRNITIPHNWETIRLRRRSINRTGEMHIDSLVLRIPQDTVSHLHHIDSATHPLSVEKIGKRSGILGYSFFNEMKRSETKNIHAFISISHSESALRDTIRIINAQEEPNKRNDTVSIFTQNILLYRYVDVRLLDPDHSFTIVQVHDSARQEVDETDGNHWQWEVTPNTDKKEARLILKVVAEKPNEPAEPFESRTIPITIHVNTNIVRQLWIYLYDHPEYVFTAILIPVVAYFGKKIFDRRKSTS